MVEVPRHPELLGPYRIDWGGLELAREGRSTRLTPKAAAVLHLLTSRAGETLSRREILDSAWTGSSSSDEVLTQVIAELRRALEDDARESRWIATIPKLGYRWVGPVPRPPDETPVPASAPVAAPRPRNMRVVVAAVVVLALFSLALAALLPRRPAAPSLSAIRPATSEPGPVLDPALSADGRRLAYVHARGDGAELRVRVLGESQFSVVPLPGAGRPSGPAWSPDGTMLAYLWIEDERCELRRVTLAETRVVTIAGDCPATLPGTVDWSPDGNSIVFARSAGGDGALAGRNIAIHRVAPDGSALARVSDAHRWLVADGHPRFARDGRRIAFVRDGEGRRRVVVTTLDGSAGERDVAFQRWAYRVAWAGDASLLVAAHGSQPAELWHVDLARDDHAALLSATAGPGIATARDTGAVVFEQRTVDDNIWRLTLDDAGAQPVAVTRAPRSELCPRVSPDGRTLAYLADDGGAPEVTLLDFAGGSPRRVSRFAPSTPVDLRWSPSGRWLAVVLGTATGKHAAIIARDGTPIELRAPLAQWRVAQVEWSADEAQLLVAVEDDGRRVLHRLPFPALDRDELVIESSIGAFAAERDGLFVRGARTGRLERVTTDASLEGVPGLVLRALPADQWLWRDGRLVELVQAGRGIDAHLLVTAPGDASAPRTLVLDAPDPPTCRGFDVGSGAIWFARRDLDRVDLLAATLAR